MKKQTNNSLINAIASGNVDKLKSITYTLKVGRLTTNECYLLYTILNENIPGKECIEYYTEQSNLRPPTEEEIRGYPRMGDKKIKIPGSDKIVLQWYEKLNLRILYTMRNCES